MNRPKFFKRQLGNAFIGAMMATGMVSFIGLAAQNYYISFVEQSRVTQIRSAMTSLESIIRSIALQPYVYSCGSDAGAASISSFDSCQMNTNYFSHIVFTPVIGSRCASQQTQCGLHLDIDQDQVRSGRFVASLSYNGEDVNLSPVSIQITLPTELLQSSSFSCLAQNPATPAFTGYASNGAPQCAGFTGLPCQPGSYISSVNFRALTVACTRLDSTNKNIACPAGQMLSSISWQNGQAFASCEAIPVAPLVGTIVNSTDPAPLPQW